MVDFQQLANKAVDIESEVNHESLVGPTLERIDMCGDKFEYRLAGDFPGFVVVKAHRFEDDGWWIDLVRVGDPGSRGNGLGTVSLLRALRCLVGLCSPRRIGLKAHGLGHGHDLGHWYERIGFVRDEEDTEIFWKTYP